MSEKKRASFRQIRHDYRRAGGDRSPAALDQRVLAAAHESARRRQLRDEQQIRTPWSPGWLKFASLGCIVAVSALAALNNGWFRLDRTAELLGESQQFRPGVTDNTQLQLLSDREATVFLRELQRSPEQMESALSETGGDSAFQVQFWSVTGEPEPQRAREDLVLAAEINPDHDDPSELTGSTPVTVPAEDALRMARGSEPLTATTTDALPTLPAGFVDLAELAPGIEVRLAYAGAENFTGATVPGYRANRALLTRPAAEALAAAQRELAAEGLTLVVFDAYRPRRAVEHFLVWAAGPADDPLLQQRFYPGLQRAELFADGYLSANSAHSRGSTVDLSIARRLEDGSIELFDMGTPFDLFSPDSGLNAQGLSDLQQQNRRFLQELMRRHGFAPFDMEWWHFTLIDEPYPEQAFDFEIH